MVVQNGSAAFVQCDRKRSGAISKRNCSIMVLGGAREKGVSLAQSAMQVGPCIPVRIQLKRTEVGPYSEPGQLGVFLAWTARALSGQGCKELPPKGGQSRESSAQPTANIFTTLGRFHI
jgi:hypothetical protein